MDVSATAPGKAVLLGEYSVLEGGPALSMAVNRYVHVEIQEKIEGLSTVCAPALNLPPARFSWEPDGTIRWVGDEHRHYGLVQSAVATLSERQAPWSPSQPGFDIFLDSRALFHEERGGRLVKLGLGSSAALTTTLVRALTEYTDQPEWSDEHWLTVLIEAHRHFQKRQGSGVDVATSFYGGVIEYRRLNGRPIANSLTLPSELELVFVWSGRSASTPLLLRRLRSWQRQHGADYAAIMDKLGTITADAIAAAHVNSSVFIECAGRFAAVLADLGERAGLEIFSPAHLELATMAKRSGLVYKPCGAGGGDLGVAMGVDVNDTKRFINLVKTSGYQAIDITSSPTGVRTIRSQ